MGGRMTKCDFGIHDYVKKEEFVDGKVKLVKICTKCGKVKIG
jgi:hypothetical protein